jgi:hypothetical protein
VAVKSRLDAARRRPSQESNTPLNDDLQHGAGDAVASQRERVLCAARNLGRTSLTSLREPCQPLPVEAALCGDPISLVIRLSRAEWHSRDRLRRRVRRRGTSRRSGYRPTVDRARIP